jgi:hypothetical protein
MAASSISMPLTRLACHLVTLPQAATGGRVNLKPGEFRRRFGNQTDAESTAGRSQTKIPRLSITAFVISQDRSRSGANLDRSAVNLTALSSRPIPGIDKNPVCAP